MNAPRDVSYDEAVVVVPRADPDFANEYLGAALEEADLSGGQVALLAALRHIAEAQGMSAVAAGACMPRESLYRALSPKGIRPAKPFWQWRVALACALTLAIR